MKTIKDLLLFGCSISLLIVYLVILMFGLIVGGSFILSLIPCIGLFGLFLHLLASGVCLFIYAALSVLPILLFF